MFRRISWRVFASVVLAVVVFSQLLTMFSPAADPRCPRQPTDEKRLKDYRAASFRTPELIGAKRRGNHQTERTPLQPPNASILHPPNAPPLHPPNPVHLHPPNPPTIHPTKKHFELVSEMNTTSHMWQWPETVALLKKCAAKDWGPLERLPDVSIIISFHNNEQIFSIIHTIHSVVQRTPSQLLREIILIDDNSVKDDLKQLLEMHVTREFGGLVRLVRSHEDLGLIRARLYGIQMSKGQVVIVMDSHVEVQAGWIEPLLYEIVQDRGTLATSYLDWMEKEGLRWTYRHGASSWKTYFDLAFTFGFQALSEKEYNKWLSNPLQPVRSAVTVGTVWAMDRKWFHEVGGFDEGMQKWGGENLDLAVRVWLFGGRVVNVPCSHVAHLERPNGRAYRDGWIKFIHHNYKRFAEVWLDDYKEIFYRHLPSLYDLDPGDLTKQLAFKARAKHNLTWFFENVFPELGFPGIHGLAWGGVRTLADSEGNLCVDSMNGFTPIMTPCTGQAVTTQGFFWTDEGFIRLSMHVLLASGGGSVPTVGANTQVVEYTGYHNTGLATRWFHIKKGPIIETGSGLCLQYQGGFNLVLQTCNGSPYQDWEFQHYTEEYETMMRTFQGPVESFRLYLKKHKDGFLVRDRRRTTEAAPHWNGIKFRAQKGDRIAASVTPIQFDFNRPSFQVNRDKSTEKISGRYFAKETNVKQVRSKELPRQYDEQPIHTKGTKRRSIFRQWKKSLHDQRQ